MADVVLFHLPLDDDDVDSSPSEFAFDDEITDDLSAPFWFAVIDEEQTLAPSASDPIDHHHHGSDTLDLFECYRPPETLDTSDFRALDGDGGGGGSDYLALDLGFEFDIEDQIDDREGRDYVDQLMDQGFGFVSDAESDHDPSLPLGLEVRRRDADCDLEWEEVDVQIDERDILSMMVGEGEGSARSSESDADEEVEQTVAEWEVLLAAGNPLIDDDGDDFASPSDYEILFGQFADAIRGSPRAAKSVIESLPSVSLTKEDVLNNNTLCAVCKDEISLEEKVKRLPCMHHYHGECILPWLCMRNTCPVCRYELSTDDPEYESWRAQRRGAATASTERYDLEMFSAV